MKPWRWLGLLAISGVFTAAFEIAHLPAALLLGAMAGGIAWEQVGGELKVPPVALAFAQALIGCMIGAMVTPAMVASFAGRWPLFLMLTLSTVLAAGGLGWAFSRLRLLPGTTAIWGLLPGGASVMVMMAEAFGADGRLVAFMQYTRVLVVATLASVVARAWEPDVAMVGGAGWFPPVAPWPVAQTVLLAMAGVMAGRLTRRLASVLLGTMAVTGALSAAGLATPSLPPWLLAVGYMLLGWSIGLRFTRPLLAAAFRALPQTLGAIAVLVAVGGAMAAALVVFGDVDPLTAYLATSPGGADAVAVIAASTPVDVSFVMTVQTARVLAVMLLGPSMSRWLARRVP